MEKIKLLEVKCQNYHINTVVIMEDVAYFGVICSECRDNARHYSQTK